MMRRWICWCGFVTVVSGFCPRPCLRWSPSSPVQWLANVRTTKEEEYFDDKLALIDKTVSVSQTAVWWWNQLWLINDQRDNNHRRLPSLARWLKWRQWRWMTFGSAINVFTFVISIWCLCSKLLLFPPPKAFRLYKFEIVNMTEKRATAFWKMDWGI